MSKIEQIAQIIDIVWSALKTGFSEAGKKKGMFHFICAIKQTTQELITQCAAADLTVRL